MNNIHTYLKKRGITGPWKIEPRPQSKFELCVVIPAYGESELLPLTLASLNTNDPSILKNTITLVVVNNSNQAPAEIKVDNQLTIEALKAAKYHFTLGIIDAASPSLELSQKHAGVGLARKIGLDMALHHLKKSSCLLFSTDADSLLDKNYLKTTQHFFNKKNIQAAVTGFKHQSNSDSELTQAIKSYELFLKSTAQKMKSAGSPYGYVAMGSTIVCTANSYAAVGGMPRKKATEDFYFLQELSKFCGVYSFPEILVYPSSRPANRVYLGTGFRMQQAQNGFDINSLHYSDEAYRKLSVVLKISKSAKTLSLNKLFEKLDVVNSGIVDFLKDEGIEAIWGKIQVNAPTKKHFWEQFNRWFDGLKTIRFLKRFSY